MMKKEKFITATILAILGLCFLMLNGCASNDDKEFYELCIEYMKDEDKTAEDLYIAKKISDLGENNSCLTCIGCANMKDGCGFGGTYYGCIDCFGVTIGDDDTLGDLFYSKKIYGGLCGSSCLSCYCVNFPMIDSDKNIKPTYGCLTGV